MIGISIGVTLARSRVSTETAATAAYAAAYATAAGSALTTARRALVDTFIGGRQASGVWQLLDGVVVAAPSTAGALVCLKDPARTLTVVGAVTQAADRGWTGDGVTGYLDWGRTPGVTGNFALNAASVGVYCNLQGATGATSHIGSVTTNRLAINSVRSTAGGEAFSINDNVADTLQSSTGSKVGHRAASRTGATTKRGFMNGTLVADLATASTSLPGGNLCILRNLTTYAPDRIAAAWFGGGMTDAQIADLHSGLHNFLTAIGANY